MLEYPHSIIAVNITLIYYCNIGSTYILEIPDN